MKVIGINGSHRRGMNTAVMLSIVLEEIKKGGGEVELLELSDYHINICKACNRCLTKPECSIPDDDMSFLAQKMIAADAVVIGSPVYFANVSSLLKIFIDRTRWMHMSRNILEGKIGAAITHAGLRNGGQEVTQIILERFLLSHGLHVVEARHPDSRIYNLAPLGTMFESLDGENIRWKKGVQEDALAMELCRSLGKNIVRKLQIRGA